MRAGTSEHPTPVAAVTGGAGAIGGAIATALRESGHSVSILDRAGDPPVDLAQHSAVKAAAADLIHRHGRCDVLVHAGDQETFGLIVIEGMACGLPVAAVGVGGTGELVTDSVGARAARPDVAEMAAAIDALFARDLARVGAAARERVLGSYSWNMAFSRLVQHYGRLAGQKIDARVPLAHAER